MAAFRLIRWARALWLWLAEGKVAFMGLLVLAAVLLHGMVTWQSEASIRLAGFFLQLFGMLFAIRGLLKIREYFRQTSLSRLFVEWVKRCPICKGRIDKLAAASVVSKSTVGATGLSDWAQDNPGYSVERRIEAIVENLDRIRDAQAIQQAAVKTLEDIHENYKKEVAQKTKRSEAKLRKDLESLHTEDLFTSFVGLVWLTIGIFLSTLAPELTCWLGFA